MPVQILTEADNDLAPKAGKSANFPGYVLDVMDKDRGELSVGTLVAFNWGFLNLGSSERIL
jgi:hypothetical protein